MRRPGERQRATDAPRLAIIAPASPTVEPHEDRALTEDVHAPRELEVVVVDDHLAMRRGMELVLRDAGFRIAGTAGTLAEARAVLQKRRYDAALLDVQLGEESSLGLVEEILRAQPAAPIVLYTGFMGSDSPLHEAVHAGARGFVLKSSPPQRVIQALRTVAEGGTFVDPDLAAALADGQELSAQSMLSERELEVLELLADGLNGQMIAGRLFLSPETVRTHVRNATAKLGARTRVQAVAMVVRGRSAR
jgi:DNA-binding NarL/FixJ family response regulator